MKEQTDFFRDVGILPPGVSPPPEAVRGYLPWGHVIGQYLGTCLMSGLGIGVALLFALGLPFPVNIAAAAPLAGFGYIVYRATRNDYTWVELDGEKLRAKHLYTRRVVERSIEEIEDLLTLVFQVRTAETLITEAWLGRVRGIMIRFRDKRTPLQVARADPAMKNAKELIEAIVFRMSEKGEVDAEVIDLEGKPLIRRIHWKEPGRTSLCA
ncbi:MAG: hypothetical protein WD403_06865 [Pirellulales bacterium]